MRIWRTCINRIHFHQGISALGLMLAFLFFFAANLSAQNETPQAIKQQMAKIRQSTNWEDPVAAKKANEQIRELSRKMMMLGKPPAELPHGLTKSEAEEMQQKGVDDKMKLWGQMMNIAREGGEWDLAKPLRDEIVQEYKDDEDPTIKNKEWFDEMTLLYIDMSSPTVQLVIDQMENYKSIQTLVITGGKNGAPVNLENLITKAAHYPLQQLYIINFMGFVTKVPTAISKFQNLSVLALYNNKISQLPTEFSSLSKLKKLYVDINPIVSLTSALSKSIQLDTLGIAKTLIPEEEITRVKQLFPNCKILLK